MGCAFSFAISSRVFFNASLKLSSLQRGEQNFCTLFDFAKDVSQLGQVITFGSGVAARNLSFACFLLHWIEQNFCAWFIGAKLTLHSTQLISVFMSLVVFLR